MSPPPTDEGERSTRPDPLADAPPADQASGIAIPAPRPKHPIANTLLAVPRAIAYVALLGPRYAAAELDDYLESRSPNAFGRDVKSSWRIGATFEVEDELGVDIAARVGRSFGNALAVDAYGGGFGARGASGGLRARLGSYTGVHLEPELSFELGRGMDRVFAGVDSRTPQMDFELDRLAAQGGLSGRIGPFSAGVRAVADRLHTDLEMGETDEAATGELSIGIDTRRPSERWIKRAAPSTGTLVRATVGHTSGEITGGDRFSFQRGRLEVEQLFDLFHGDRVLSLSGGLDGITTDDVPFDRLPALGGPDHMRAYVRDELRARRFAYGAVTYSWPLGPSSSAYLFVEGATSSDIHVSDYGGGIRMFSKSSTTARLQLAASPTGDVGAFLQIGAL